jgi:hypothetical protein
MVAGMMSDVPSRTVIRGYVTEVWRISSAYLASSGFAERLADEAAVRDPGRSALRLVEDLFQQDADGVFIRIRGAYGSLNWTLMSNIELWNFTRRFVEVEITRRLCHRVRAFPAARTVRPAQNIQRAS